MNREPQNDKIRITIKVFGGLRESFQSGTQVYRLSSQATLGLLLQELKIDFPELSKKLLVGIDAGYLSILINGRNVRFLQGQDTGLHDGDTVAFLPPMGGG
ncbi:MoaD/ThiS family protein [Candidatus Bipolaricaulota bacterium]|nr:MoaD/ThiS family protein [Candidatus Bipolaricaulota bacterium]MCK5585773.1 MoaD/ThiS family protein [Candidatus Bipolaricaulota bacterium]